MSKRWIAAAAHALIKKGSKYLILQRAAGEKYMPMAWDIPGGVINFKEEILHALYREVMEETGIKVRQKKLLFVYGNRPKLLNSHHFQLIFLCHYVSGKIRLSRDHRDYRWVTLKELQKIKTIHFLNAYLKDFKNGNRGLSN
ncbi:MAG: NUDIX domain-containing protein [Patescibacteria group bacterium]|jgi:8-oxo-dGTP diphosphatase